MSSLVQIGATLSEFQEHDKSPVVTRSESGDIVERKGYILKTRVKAFSDGLSYGQPDGEYPNAKLSLIAASPLTGAKSEITLTYTPVNVTFETIPAVGTVVQEIDSNAIDIPIAKAAGISDSEIFEEKKDGVESYLSPQPIYRRTEILGSFTFNEANAIDDVGKIDNTPADLVAPSATKWLKVGLVVRSVGDKFEQVETWQYAENGWDTNIYTSVA